MRIAHSDAFLLWICGGSIFSTILLFYNSRFHANHASLSIMFNFGAYPAFSNVSYKISYERNMSVSLLVFMGSIKIVFVSYSYSINMYCIPLLILTGKRPVKYVYTFPVSGSARPTFGKSRIYVFLSQGIFFSISSAS